MMVTPPFGIHFDLLVCSRIKPFDSYSESLIHRSDCFQSNGWLTFGQSLPFHSKIFYAPLDSSFFLGFLFVAEKRKKYRKRPAIKNLLIFSCKILSTNKTTKVFKKLHVKFKETLKTA